VRVGRYRAIYKLHVWSRGPPEEITVLAGELLSCLLVVADLSLAGLLGQSGRSPPSSWQREGKRNPSRGALASLSVEETPPVRSSVRFYLFRRALTMSANESGSTHSELAWSAAKIAELRQRLIGVAGTQRRDARDQRDPCVRIRLTIPREYLPWPPESSHWSASSRSGGERLDSLLSLSYLSLSLSLYRTSFLAKESLRSCDSCIDVSLLVVKIVVIAQENETWVAKPKNSFVNSPLITFGIRVNGDNAAEFYSWTFYVPRQSRWLPQESEMNR